MSKYFVHYQERAVRQDGTPFATLTDIFIPLEELEEMFDDIQVESLLNTVGDYDDNGVVYLNRNGFVVPNPGIKMLPNFLWKTGSPKSYQHLILTNTLKITQI